MLLDSLLFDNESSDKEKDEGQGDKIVRALMDGKRKLLLNTIQIMQLPRMKELSMCMQSSTLTQTDLLQCLRPI